MTTLHVEAEGTARAAPEAVWALVSDATPTAEGTHVRWAATWDPTMAGRIVWRSLRTVYPQIVASLITAAERQAP